MLLEAYEHCNEGAWGVSTRLVQNLLITYLGFEALSPVSHFPRRVSSLLSCDVWW